MGSFPFPEAGRHLRPIHRGGEDGEAIAASLKRYLAKTDPQYYSLARFAKTYGQHQPLKLTQPDVVDCWFSPELLRLTASSPDRVA